MCVIGRGRGGEGRNVGLIYSPPPPFFQAVPSARLCKVGDGGGGEGSVADGQILARGESSANERADSIVPDQW